MAILLQYGLKQSRRRRTIKVIVLSLCALSGLGLWHWRHPLFAKIDFQYSQWRCMHFSMPPERLAFDNDLGEGRQLASQDSRFHFEKSDLSDRLPFYVFSFSPFDVVVQGNGQSDDSWLTPPITGRILFLHERISPCGNRRLVAVAVAADNCFITDSIKPVGWFQEPPAWRYSNQAWVSNIRNVLLAPLFSGGDPEIAGKDITKIFFGQVDPNDSSHFTLKYQFRGQDGLIDGWLCDSEAVYLRPRFGPRMQWDGYYDQIEKLIGFDSKAALAGKRDPSPKN